MSKKRTFTACLRPVHGLQFSSAQTFFMRQEAVNTANLQHYAELFNYTNTSFAGIRPQNETNQSVVVW